MNNTLVNLYDEDFNLIQIFDEYRSLQWSLHVDNLSTFSITFFGEHSFVNYIKDTIIDNRLPIIYFEVVTQFKHKNIVELRGLVTKGVFQRFANGNSQVQLVGNDLRVLLTRRKIGYAANTPYSKKKNDAVTVIKEFINENLGIGANNDIRQGGANNGIKILSVGSNGLSGITWEGSKTNEILFSVINDIRNHVEEEGGLISIVADFDKITKKIYIDIIPTISGSIKRDKVFSIELDNIESITETLDESDPNLVTATGKTTQLLKDDCGSFNYTPVITISDKEKVDKNNINLVESELTTTKANNRLELYDSANEWKVRKQLPPKTTIVPKNTVDGYLYGLDIFVGDVVIIHDFFNKERYKLIESAQVQLDSNKERRVSINLRDYEQ